MKPIIKKVAAFFLVSAVIAGAWFAFISIVAPLPISATPALVMVWLSVFILLMVLFPNILDKIKKIKVKDFELELQETVAKATSKDFLSTPNLDEHIFSTKGGFRNLGNIIMQTKRYPEKPVLLMVNLEDNISITMLFIYLFFLDIVGACVTILFVTSKQPIRNLSDIKKDSIIGAVLGKRVIRIFFERFPRLYRIFDFRRFQNNNRIDDGFQSWEAFFLSGSFDEGHEGFFRQCYDAINGEDRSEFLSLNDVENWFKFELSKHGIELLISDQDIKEIRQALSKENEFLLVFRENRLNSVVSICYLTRDMSRKILENLSQTK